MGLGQFQRHVVGGGGNHLGGRRNRAQEGVNVRWAAWRGRMLAWRPRVCAGWAAEPATWVGGAEGLRGGALTIGCVSGA